MRLFVVSLIAMGAVGSLLPAVPWSANQRSLRRAANALADGEWRDARRLAEQASAGGLPAPPAARLAFVASAESRDNDDRLAWRETAGHGPDAGDVAALLAWGEVQLRRGRPDDAERALRRAVEIDPSRPEAHERLVHLLESEGRTWDAVPHLTALLQSGRFAGEHLLLIGSVHSQLLDGAAFTKQWLAAEPGEVGHLLPDARIAMLRNQNQQARQWLSQIVAVAPEQIEAQAWLGRLLAETAPLADFLAWQAAAPAQADTHPETWFARGLWAQRAGQTRAAARCYWEALRRYPQHMAANYQFAQILISAGRSEQALPFAERARRLARLEDLLRDARGDPTLIPQVVAEEEALGRYWEAAGWCHLALREDPGRAWPRPMLRRLHCILAREPALLRASADPTRRIDLSDWPLPRWTDTEAEDTNDVKHPPVACGVSFADRAADAGIGFRYFNGTDPASGTVWMFEFSGGGAAVLDYDGDLWPDLYLTQGCRWPPDHAQREHLDQLYRNLGGERFQEVGGLAGLQDNAFSQGAAIGDVDGDGFPDIYLGNIGPNRLYLNQGDGTFREVTATSGTAGDDWTTSCALADFDGDGLADLYVVNYLRGDVFERRCENNGKRVQCAPAMFPAADDRLYRNLGDGAFEEVALQCGASGSDGKGLGLVVADFDGSRRLSVFVSNDTTANFFFANQTPTRGGPLLFAETAVISGLAFDEQGRAQACMGVAFDDANLDGRPDLFVTNFFRESNALYQQQPDGTFRDEARAARLRDPSFALLGWGTQFLDGELDGLPDLLVLNGHINDFSASGTPYRMPPQYFSNVGSGKFAEAAADTLGGYFQGRYLGRALARLDWNRDGLEDACATHVDAPVALLTNQTARHGHFLAVRLVGVASARDALGAKVRLRCGTRVSTKQLTAGDGFEAGNERRLVFGLGAAERIDELVVSWPAGMDQRFSGLPADCELTIIEGRDLQVVSPPPR